MEYTGYLDFWFTNRPIVERIAPFVALGIRQFNVFFWRQVPIVELVTECQRHGVQLYSTFDDDMGSLADPGDNERTLRSWAESRASGGPGEASPRPWCATPGDLQCARSAS